MSALIICAILTLAGAAAGFAAAHVLARSGRERERTEARTRLSDSIREVDFLRTLEGHYVCEIAELRSALGGAAGSKTEADIQDEFRTAVRNINLFSAMKSPRLARRGDAHGKNCGKPRLFYARLILRKKNNPHCLHCA